MNPTASGRGSVITVSVVEDSHRVRESLSVLINGAPGLRCLSTFASAEQALRHIPREQPDVVLMDIHLGRGLSGIDCVRQLKTIDPARLVVMLTAYEDEDLIFQALKAGASGYLLKQTPPDELLGAIADAHQGGAPMTSNIARKVIRSFHENEKAATLTDRLTPREREILEHLAKGYQYKEIADHLSVSYTTVNTHIKAIYTKLHVRSRMEAVNKYRNP
ncbi:MAG: response regulator transcription factor [Verrucomicrobiales bacterium]|nr:response regulator transcription factor [Verrucomicrobiales bacterium]